MNGSLAQVTALVAWGNAALAGTTPGAPLLSSNSAFRFVRSVSFLTAAGGSVTTVAQTPEEWFTWLGHHGCLRLRLELRPPSGPLPGPVAAGFVGGEQWFIGEEGGSRVWLPQWILGERSAPDPWTVLYHRADVGRRPPTVAPALGAARSALAAALAGATDVARRLEGFASWTGLFAAAAALLDEPGPAPPSPDDGLPPGRFSEEARRLFAAATAAWVFGGMGSWNDVTPPAAVAPTYSAATTALYEAVLAAVAAVLASDAPRGAA